MALQVGEYRTFHDISTAADRTPGRSRAVRAAISAGIFGFGAIGLLLMVFAGPRGANAPPGVHRNSLCRGSEAGFPAAANSFQNRNDSVLKPVLNN
jgi:hypothetical protein